MTTHPATAEALEKILRVTAKEWNLDENELHPVLSSL
ncbi:hypothetical protein PCO31110_01639 [Pandoraea communis]|uniref:Uncharacterized protein n=1 Tax=Pandoraea communis TaxID=2508297 RepID=A0A5E4TXV7_9BURK|nr:hypothetical protein PCO31110_01639 [Pandoraea communis]